MHTYLDGFLSCSQLFPLANLQWQCMTYSSTCIFQWEHFSNTWYVIWDRDPLIKSTHSSKLSNTWHASCNNNTSHNPKIGTTHFESSKKNIKLLVQPMVRTSNAWPTLLTHTVPLITTLHIHRNLIALIARLI